MGVREDAVSWLNQVPPMPQQVNSVGSTAALFTKLTGVTQSYLQTQWAAGKNFTTCNAFVNKFGQNALKSKTALGVFGLKKACQDRGKAYAWVDCTPGLRPQKGDIFEIQGRLHVGISCEFQGDVWITAEGGQGGKSTGFDIVKRKKALQTPGGMLLHQTIKNNAYVMEFVQGWVDIDLYMNGLPYPVPMAPWLLGWWVVPWRGQLFYYYFEAPGKVSWTLKKPINTAFVPYKFDDVGSVVFDSRENVTIKWNTTQTVEQFKPVGSDHLTMVGDWNSKEPLLATRGIYYNPTTI